MEKRALFLLLALSFGYTSNVFADSDMFRSIEQFERTEMDRLKKAGRYPTYFQASDVSDCGTKDCRSPCVKAAEKYFYPKFNGEPVVAEQPY